MSLDLTQLKEMINYICSEKNLDPDEIIKAIERAIASSYRKEFGDKDKAYTAEFNVTTGQYVVYEETRIVEEVISPAKEISVAEARLYNPYSEVGELIRKEVVSSKDMNFGRIASQIGRQVLMQSINASRHSKIIQEFKGKVGNLVTVEVDYAKKGGYLVKLSQTVVFMGKENLCPTDRFKPGQLIKAVILDIKEDEQGNAKIILSRSAPEFALAIIRQEIPEVEIGSLIIEKLVREAGSRIKILVSANEDEDLDPVGTILGRKNIRITNIMREINSQMQEKIDVIEYIPDDIALMIMDALEPARIDKVEVDEENNIAEIYCQPEEAFLAVGKRGVNIRLASKLLNYTLNIVSSEKPALATEVTEEADLVF
jgi:transcription termination/antitermination protein NusA